MADSQGSDEFSAEILRRLRARRPWSSFVIAEKIGEGAMGVVHRAHDEDLRRDVALKLLRDEALASGRPASTRSLRLGRFIDEMQVTAQLDHPGVVAVHDIGLDERERPYFSMKLVRGQTLKDVFDAVRQGREGWTITRALSVLLKVCDAMSYAHSKKVIHRDLKPSNVMVGRFGEVYVMDWGLARVLDRPERKDIRIREPELELEAGATSQVDTDRHAHVDSDPGSPLYTMDGDVVGTPAYMSPEQANGVLERVGPQADVYSLGAILYHLLTGQMPYVTPATRVDNYAIWRWVREGPPAPLEVLASKQPGELVAICDKAMERDVAQRYGSMHELAEDLRAYLEGRVVRAHGTGRWPELKKWVIRNKVVAALLLALGAVLVSGVTTVVAKELDLRHETQLSLDESRARELLRRSDEIGPIDPDNAFEFEVWLADARELIGRRASYARAADELEGTAFVSDPLPPDRDAVLAHRNAVNYADEFTEILERKERLALAAGASASVVEEARAARAVLPDEIARWREMTSRLSQATEPPGLVGFEDGQSGQQYGRLKSLVFALDTLARDAEPLVARRLQLARGLADASCTGAAAAAWDAAIRRIGDRAARPEYNGLALRPQMGLVPLGENEQGLWEFWHVLSGDRPLLDDRGRHVVGPETGIVLVLIPGATTTIGAQKDDPSAPHYDPNASPTERTYRVTLAPYFLSKYELTQGQWFRIRGELPSEHFAGHDNAWDPRISRANPLEHVSFDECRAGLALVGLLVPTEAQWEFGARGGSDLRYLRSAFAEDVRCIANLADDRFALTQGARWTDDARDDCHAVHAAVGSFEPNGYGLFDVLGNVAEWCRDWYCDAETGFEILAGDGERQAYRSTTKVYRGGSFKSPPTQLRISARQKRRPTERDDYLGVRPVRALDT